MEVSVKKLLLFCLFSLMLVLPAGAIHDGETDYTELMLACALSGDWEMGQYAQFGRMAKEPEEVNITFEDLFLLAKIIYAEAGSHWLSDEWKMAVGEVVLNRAQQGVLASQLQGVGGSMNLRGIIRGEDILVVADRSARRQGKGELLFWK